MYNETGIKKTMLVSPEQDQRLKAYCKLRHVSASQLFRLFIDELSVSQLSTLKDEIKLSTFHVDQFVSPNKNIIKEVVNDGNGSIKTTWFGNIRRQINNSFPNTNHY